jgi:serine/threonine-protein kinase RsbW
VAVSNHPDNVALVRAVLAGLAPVVGFDDALDDVKAAVSEACNNVVAHAYDGDEGPLEVDIHLLREELEVVVRDRGVGLSARATEGGDSSQGLGSGLGFSVMEALADQLELRPVEPGGTEVAMSFRLRAPPALPEMPGDPPGFESLREDAGTIQVAVSPASLGAGVFARLMSAAAARAGFSIDRLSDAQLLADSLTGHVEPLLSGSGVCFGIGVGERSLEIELGPLRQGGARIAVADSAIADLGPLIETLAEEIDASPRSEGEMLAMVMRDRPPRRTPAG